MKNRKRAMALVCVVAVLAALAAGCGREAGVTFTAAVVGSITTLDPALAAEPAEQTAVVHLYENLMKLQNTAQGGTEAVPAVARNYRRVDNLDGTETYVFTLRSDARWADGRSVRAADFVYAWQHLVDPATASPHAALLNMVSGYEQARQGDPSALAVTAENGVTLRVELSCRCDYFLRAICTASATMPRRADLENSVADGAVGNGAYCLAGRQDTELTLTALERYYDARRLGVDTLRLLLCGNTEEAAALLGSGAADFACHMTEDAAQGEGWDTEPYPQTTLLLVNQMAQQLESRNVRQALSLALDRTALAAVSGGGLHTAAEGLIPYGITLSDGSEFRLTEGARMDNSDYAANCDAARKLLEQVGLRAFEPEAFTGVSILYSASGINSRIAESIQTMWKEQLGIPVKLRGVSSEEMETALAQGEFSVALYSWTGDRNDPTAFLDMWRSGSPNNAALFHSVAYDLLLRAAAASSSAAARDAYLADAELLLLEQGNAIPLYWAVGGTALRAGWTRPVYDGLGVYRFGTVRRTGN